MKSGQKHFVRRFPVTRLLGVNGIVSIPHIFPFRKSDFTDKRRHLSDTINLIV